LADCLDSRNGDEAADANNGLTNGGNSEGPVAESAAVSNILERCSREGVLLSLTREARLGDGGGNPPPPVLMAAIEARVPAIVAELIKAKHNPERDFET
jgi:hypothetical protein